MALRARRARTSPPSTSARRLADRGRAATTVVAARAGQAAATAAPRLENAKQVALHRGAGIAAAAAASMRAAARRSSADADREAEHGADCTCH